MTAPGSTDTGAAPVGRLKRRSEFIRARRGRSWRTASLVLQARGARGGGPARFGFTATRKLGSAVRRNRARRRLKEAVRRLPPQDLRPGYDYVVIARQGTLTRTFADIVKELQTALRKVHETDPGARAQGERRRRAQPTGSR